MLLRGAGEEEQELRRAGGSTQHARFDGAALRAARPETVRVKASRSWSWPTPFAHTASGRKVAGAAGHAVESSHEAGLLEIIIVS